MNCQIKPELKDKVSGSTMNVIFQNQKIQIKALTQFPFSNTS